jgi:hypothetical protein
MEEEERKVEYEMQYFMQNYPSHPDKFRFLLNEYDLNHLMNEFKDDIDFDLSIFDKCIEEDESFFYRNRDLNIILQLSEEIVIEN